MTFLTAFAVTLLIAVLVSGLADRSILSTAVLFLLAGVTTGASGLRIVDFKPTSLFVEALLTTTLFTVLFTDGMLIGLSDLRQVWHLPGRALLFGMPLSLLAFAALAHWLTELNWLESFLLGAILSPTDPVFAAALVGRKEVPAALRRLLNVESGLNDGLALPLVIFLLEMASHEPLDPFTLGSEVVGGLLLGVAIPWVVVRLEKSPYFGASEKYRPLSGFAIGLLVLTAAHTLGANEYLAAFSAGVTLVTVDPKLRDSFHHFGELVAELLKLAALLTFGSLISVQILADIDWTVYLFAVLALVAVRPAAIGISLLGSGMPWEEQATAAWFGPKGFASVAYSILVLRSGIPNAERIFSIVAIVIGGSILLHSSTDVPVANAFAKRSPKASGS